MCFNCSIFINSKIFSDEVDVKLLKTSGFIRMDREEFKKTYGVEPIRMIDLKALMGDPSDHIPGVKGIFFIYIKFIYIFNF